MKSVLPLFVVTVLAACGSIDTYEPDHDGGDLSSLDARIQIEGELRELLDVENLIARTDSGQADVQFDLVNEGDETLRLTCRLRWKDADGFFLDNRGSSDDRILILEADETKSVRFSCPDPEAKQFVCFFPDIAKN